MFKNKRVLIGLIFVILVCVSTWVYVGLYSNGKVNNPGGTNVSDNKNNNDEEYDGLVDVDGNGNKNDYNIDGTETNGDDENSENNGDVEGNQPGDENTVTNPTENNNGNNNGTNIVYRKPQIAFTKNGDAVESLSNSTKVVINGDYYANTMKFMISTSNVTPVGTWRICTTDTVINLSGLNGRVYVWASVVGRDGLEVRTCSKAFVMKSKYEVPTISFTKNGDNNLTLINTTSIVLGGEYYAGTLKYMISNSNTAPSGTWRNVNPGQIITISGVTGKMYVWASVVGKDGLERRACSGMFNMKSKYEEPVVKFSKNGDLDTKIVNTLSATVTGDYNATTLKYMISTSNQSPAGKWVTYTNGSQITISGVTGKVYVWISVTGRDGIVRRTCSEAFEMKASWEKPVITFTKNGDSQLKLTNSTSANITGDYSSVKYMISISGTTPQGIWNTYAVGSNIPLSGITGKYYVWISVIGKDSKTYTVCSNYFNMKASWDKPVINFTKNGEAALKLTNSTTVNVTGEYDASTLKYMISTNGTTPQGTWTTYTNGSQITISGVTGKYYIWITVIGRDGKTYTSCSSYFNMKASWDKPVITFTKNGDSNINIVNSTIVNIAGDYETNSVKYMISTSNVSETGSWLPYTVGSTISINNAVGKRYVWVSVIGMDGNNYTICSNAFEMVKEFPEITPDVRVLAKNGKLDFLTGSRYFIVSFEIRNPRLKNIQYAITYNSTERPASYKMITSPQYNPNLDSQTITVQSDNFVKTKEEKVYLWLKLTDEFGKVYDLSYMEI